MRLNVSLALLVLAVALCGAQSRDGAPTRDPVQTQHEPTFSGTWKLNREKSDLRVWAKITPDSVVIAQSAKQIEFNRQIRGKWSSASYTLDGREQTISTFDHHEKVGRAHWSKGALIIEERTVVHFVGMPDVEDAEKTTTRWILSDDQKVLTERNQERSTTTVFDRQQ